MRSFLRFLSVLFILLLIVAGGALLMGYRFIHAPVSNAQEAVVFEVRPGESLKTIANHLQEQQLVKNAILLELYARVSGQAKQVRVGQYAIRHNANPMEVMAVITSGRSIEYPFTVQEGFNIYEIAARVEEQHIGSRQDFLDIVRDPAVVHELLGEDHPTLEGFLFPETYKLTKFTSAKMLVRMMVARFKENYVKLAKLGQSPLSRYELVTLASIIEKETGAPEERPVISSVFHNRLKKNMRLETDPTVIYGIWDRDGTWNGNISRADLTTPTRYNTYSFTGLPFGPISNPGFEALKAALLPSTSDYLFFVSRNDGTHRFSADYKGHLKAVAEFQLDRKAREGKSWRDLKLRDKGKGAELSPAVPDVVKKSGH